jgi:hypothetical protein
VGILETVDIVIAVIAASAFLAAAVLLIGRVGAFAGRRRRGVGRRRAGGDGSARIRSCPLCASVLEPGERVHSKLYPGKGDRIMHIFGCPRCWPATPSAPRICPVCGREIGREGYAVARYFDRPGTPGGGARPHIHVLGCTECRK